MASWLSFFNFTPKEKEEMADEALLDNTISQVGDKFFKDGKVLSNEEVEKELQTNWLGRKVEL